MKLSEVVSRARSTLGHGCIYKLGKGGFNPASPVPWDGQGCCDCSGFVSWCLGVSRHVEDPRFAGSWLETSAIFRDAQSPFGWFDALPWELAQAGHIVVWPDRRKLGRLRQGHIGIFTSPSTVIHCSSGSYRRTGDAIAEDPPDLWIANGALVARCAFISA